MECLLAEDETTPSDEKWAIKMEDSKISPEEYVHVFSVPKTESMIKIRNSGRLMVHTECSHGVEGKHDVCERTKFSRSLGIGGVSGSAEQSCNTDSNL